MLRSYLVLALRTLARRRGFAAINIAGLALGIACCLLLFVYVRSERSVDAVFEDADRIYRVGSRWKDEAMGLPITAPAAVGEAMVGAFPEVEAQVRLWAGWVNVHLDGQPALRRNAYVADPSVLTFFGLPLLSGNPATALQGERPVVIHERLARALFGTTDVLGREVRLETYNNGEQPYTVTGVMRELPHNSFSNLLGDPAPHEIIVPVAPEDFVQQAGWESWDNRYLLVYVKLRTAAAVAGLREKLAGFIARDAPEPLRGVYTPLLEPLRTLYLDGGDGQNRKAVWLLSGLAALLLLVACINFANLSTAQALARAREVGVRKALGARRGQLLRQFLGEALVVCAVATVFGVAVAQLLQEPFFALAGKPLVLPRVWDAPMLLALFGTTLVTGVLAGAYPGLVLSAFDPVHTLKGSLRASPVTAPLRRVLVVTQFAVAVLLLSGGYVVHRQLAYVSERPLGFDREHVLAIASVPRDWTPAGVARLQAVKERLAAVPGVRAVSLSWETPGGGGGNTSPARRAGQPRDAAVAVSQFVVDADYDETYGLKLAAGRFFEAGRPADAGAVLVNEQAAKVLGLEGPGSTIVLGDTSRAEVIGVVKDFHFDSLREPLRPLVFFNVAGTSIYRLFSLRLAPEATRATVEQVEAAWHAVLPEAAFEFTFVDDDVAALYATEARTRTVVALAAGLAVLIACLGLVGLVSLSVVQRRKEIGVRKVLGASAGRIVALFVRDFGVLVLAGVVVAVPAAYFLAARWLDDFAYRVVLGPGPFLLAGAAAVAVSLVVVGTLAARAASDDPAKALRYE